MPPRKPFARNPTAIYLDHPDAMNESYLPNPQSRPTTFQIPPPHYRPVIPGGSNSRINNESAKYSRRVIRFFRSQPGVWRQGVCEAKYRTQAIYME